jgi:hypothetical protein
MTTAKGRQKRSRGSIDLLPSGAMRVRVYAGKDPLTGRRHDLIETVPAGPSAAKARTRLLSQVDERRNPRTRATVNQLLDRYEKTIDVDRTTKRTYLTYIRKHIRPVRGKLQAGRIDGEILDSFYSELRRCRDHCDGGKSRIDHRTAVEHKCDERCGPHRCKPLAASTIRQIHWILSGAFDRARAVGLGLAEPYAAGSAAGDADTGPAAAERRGRRPDSR